MKKIELYECGICGTQYNDKDVCTMCETNHVEFDKLGSHITEAKYISFKRDTSGLPTTITLLGSDGKQYLYRR